MSTNKHTKSITAEDLNLEVVYSELAYNKIMYWCKKAAPQEISGLGNVQYDKEEGVLRVTDVWLLEQENGAATTDMDEEAVGKLMYKHHTLVREGKIKGDLKLWWHSHVNMDVFWSGTDMDTIKQLGEGGWFLSSVFNLREEIKSCVSMTDPMKLFIDDIPNYIEGNYVDKELIKETLEDLDYDVKDIDSICQSLSPKLDDSLIKELDKEFKENVTVKTYHKTNTKGHNRYPAFDDYYGSLGERYSWFENDGWNFQKKEKEDVEEEKRLKKVEEVMDDVDLVELMSDIQSYLTYYPHITAEQLLEDMREDYPYVDILPYIKRAMANKE